MQTLSIFAGFMLFALGMFVFGEALDRCKKGFDKELKTDIYSAENNAKLNKLIRKLEIASAFCITLATISLFAGVVATSVRLIFF